MLTHSGPPSSEPPAKSPWRNPLLYSSIAVGIALLAVAWIFFSRWQDNREIDRKTSEERAAKQRENDQTALQQLGGKDLDIQMFYAIPASIRRGESAQLCYGVSNAKNVKLEPQSNPVWPSHSRCVDVSPAKTTTYTLTIDDGAGATKTQTVEIKVR